MEKENMIKQLKIYSSEIAAIKTGIDNIKTIPSLYTLLRNNFRKKFGILEETDWDGIDLKLGNVGVYGYNPNQDEIQDSENYTDFNNVSFDDVTLFKEQWEQELGSETYSFDPNYFDENIKNYKDSMKLIAYMTIIFKEYVDICDQEKEIFTTQGFMPTINYSNYDECLEEVYYSKELDIYLIYQLVGKQIIFTNDIRDFEIPIEEV